MPKRPPTRRRAPARPNHRPRPQARFIALSLGALLLGLQATSCQHRPAPLPPARQATAPATPTAPALPAAAGFEDCRQHFAGGLPPIRPNAPRLRELCFDAFAVLHSGHTRSPVYVAERLNRQHLQQAQGVARTDRFFADARLPRAERAELDDYRGSGYARGHMAPAGDMPTATAMAQSFSLANMVPQDQAHNSGPWSSIEQDTRKYVMRAQGDVYVVTGPAYAPDYRDIGRNGVAVPTALFKLVYDPHTGKSWAHWQQNAPKVRPGPPISYDELTRRIGKELMPVLRQH